MVFTIVDRRRLGLLRSVLFVFSCLLLSTPSLADAIAPDVQTAVRNGTQLEQTSNWKEAIRYYKQALEKFPEDSSLAHGLRRSQFQFSVARRYSDDSFVRTLRPMSRDAALDLFDDVLTNVQTHFVDSINTTSILAHGTESLWLALGNERFVDRNLFGASGEQIEKVRRTLFEKYWNKPVRHRMAAREVIAEVCDLCHKTIGLEAGPVVMEYVFGACNCLDDYSNVLTPAKRQDLYGNIQGEFVGIGIIMEAEMSKGMKLEQVLPKSPAAEAGLKRGDVIVGVQGRDCRFISTEEAASQLTGKSGTRVELEIFRDGATFTVTCTRREVKVNSITVARIIDSENGVGYIQMAGFQQSTVREMDAALHELRRQGMRSLIWDLRENPGGLLSASIEVVDRFISEGVIVSTKGRAADQNTTYTARRPGTWDIPLVLLIDGHSASASEIVAGAVRDHGRGVLVGRTSFGKWSVQSIYDARYGTALRLTTAKFYAPKGETFGKRGLQPDVVVQEGPKEWLLGDVDVEGDPDVREALRHLRQGTEFTRR